MAELDYLKIVDSVDLPEWLSNMRRKSRRRSLIMSGRFWIPPALSSRLPARLPDLETEWNVAHRVGR